MSGQEEGTRRKLVCSARSTRIQTLSFTLFIHMLTEWSYCHCINTSFTLFQAELLIFATRMMSFFDFRLLLLSPHPTQTRTHTTFNKLPHLSQSQSTWSPLSPSSRETPRCVHVLAVSAGRLASGNSLAEAAYSSRDTMLLAFNNTLKVERCCEVHASRRELSRYRHR